MTRARLVVGNWKMNPPSVDAAVALARAVAETPPPAHVAVGVAPPSVALVAVSAALRGSPVAVYAQDVHWEDRGAHTGAIAASMLAGHATGTIVGHSEVRREQGDDDARVARKLARAVAGGLRVVLCVGESEAEFLAGETERLIVRQIAVDAAPLQAARERSGALVVAYEPIWAIGTGRPATPTHASNAARVIRRALDGLGLDGAATAVLYGGSVTAASAPEFAAADGIDGALVGGASLAAAEFASIVRAFG